MKLEELAGKCGEWLRGSGPDSDIVVSSRIRLARNLADFPFIRRCTGLDRAAIEQTLRDRFAQIAEWRDVTYLDVNGLPDVDRQFLVERQLISREHAEADGARGVAIDPNEQFSVMVNEEDHLRIQVMHSGLDLQAAWEQINRIDDLLEEQVTYAFHDQLGYLTACPTNVGTGMRVSVMLHLPALVLTRQIDKVFRSLQKINLAVRGLYGEGSQAMGDFYQISNQITLGKTEAELLQQVGEVAPAMIEYERKARESLINESRKELHDRVSRAYGLLCTAQTISSEETMQLLSSVRMGVNLGLIHDVAIPTVNQLFIHTQPAHLQKLRGMELDTADRNIERANYLQRHLKGGSTDEGMEKNLGVSRRDGLVESYPEDRCRLGSRHGRRSGGGDGLPGPIGGRRASGLARGRVAGRWPACRTGSARLDHRRRSGAARVGRPLASRLRDRGARGRCDLRNVLAGRSRPASADARRDVQRPSRRGPGGGNGGRRARRAGPVRDPGRRRIRIAQAAVLCPARA